MSSDAPDWVKEVRDELLRGLEEGSIHPQEILALGEVLEVAGARVEIPDPSPDAPPSAMLTWRFKRCGKSSCRACAPGKRGHGPYLYRSWRDADGKTREKYLGRAPTQKPSASPRPDGAFLLD